MKRFLKSLAMAAGSGAATAVLNYAMQPDIKIKPLAVSAGIGAIIGVAAYIKQPPAK